VTPACTPVLVLLLRKPTSLIRALHFPLTSLCIAGAVNSTHLDAFESSTPPLAIPHQIERMFASLDENTARPLRNVSDMRVIACAKKAKLY
jgi:hypothetical protein